MLKNLKLSFIISSILYMALGIVLLVWKDTTLDVICYAFGGITLFYGLFRLASYLGNRENASVLQADNFIGIIMIGLGIFFLLNRSVIQSVLPIVLGLFVIFNSIIKLQYAFELKGVFYEKWWILLFLGIVTAILGTIVAVNKFPTPDVSLLAMGGVLVTDGISNIFTVAFSSFIQWQTKRSTTDLAVVGATAETVMEDAEVRVADIPTEADETPTLAEPVVIEVADEPIEVEQSTPTDTDTLPESTLPMEDSTNLKNTSIDNTKESVD